MSKSPQPVTGGTRLYKRLPGLEHSIVFTIHGDDLVDFGDERMRVGGLYMRPQSQKFNRMT